MIVTVTLNAALDVSYEAEGLSWQSTRDVSRVRHRAGGRGVTVARVLHTFGHEVLAAGLAGGATGELIREDLGRSGIPVAFTGIGRESRRILEVADTASGRTMRLREPGPYVTTEELGRFAGDYRRLLADATAVVLCGTLPAGLPQEIYGSLATWAAEAGVPVILSASGSALRYAASRRPDLVVPDPGGDALLDRLEGSSAGDALAGGALAGGDALLRLGAAAAAVPAGDHVGVVTKAGRWNAYLASPGTVGPDGAAPGSPGALVAGLVPGFLLGWSWPDLLRHAIAVAAAANRSGDINLRVYERLVDGVTVETALAAEVPFGCAPSLGDQRDGGPGGAQQPMAPGHVAEPREVAADPRTGAVRPGERGPVRVHRDHLAARAQQYGAVPVRGDRDPASPDTREDSGRVAGGGLHPGGGGSRRRVGSGPVPVAATDRDSARIPGLPPGQRRRPAQIEPAPVPHLHQRGPLRHGVHPAHRSRDRVVDR